MIYVGQQEQPFGLDLIQSNQLLLGLLIVVFSNVIIVAIYESVNGTSKVSSPKSDIIGGIVFLFILIVIYTFFKPDQDGGTTVLLFAAPIIMLIKGIVRLMMSRKKEQTIT